MVRNQLRTYYWISSFFCAIVGLFLLFFGLKAMTLPLLSVIGPATFVAASGILLILVAVVLAFLAGRT